MHITGGNDLFIVLKRNGNGYEMVRDVVTK